MLGLLGGWEGRLAAFLFAPLLLIDDAILYREGSYRPSIGRRPAEVHRDSENAIDAPIATSIECIPCKQLNTKVICVTFFV